MSKPALFTTITGADWARAIPAARARRKARKEAIKQRILTAMNTNELKQKIDALSPEWLHDFAQQLNAALSRWADEIEREAKFAALTKHCPPLTEPVACKECEKRVD